MSRVSACLALIAVLGVACSNQPTDQNPVPEAGAGGAGGSGGSGQCEAVRPGPTALRLLTRVQYNNTVRDLLGDGSRPAERFPAEAQQGGFDNNAELHRANALLVERYLEAAESLATRAVEARLDELAPCAADAAAADCIADFAKRFGRLAFRRTLTEKEVAILGALAQASPDGNYKTAVSLVLQAFLQAPQFLYRTEFERPADEESGAVLLGSFELASRLSYFLWDSTPDEDLLTAAEKGELSTPEGVESQARRMLDSPKARDAVSNFHRQWALIDGFRDVIRIVPGMPPESLAQAWQQSLQLFLDSVFWGEGKLPALFRSPSVFVNGELARLYDAPPPADPAAFTPVSLPDGRKGLLTQPALLALLALPDQTSPIRRGVFLREHILCDPIPPPPPDVNPTPPDPDPSLTTRERFKIHTEDPTCAQCHTLIDPVGFGFEGFDWAGKFRATENGLPVDVSGDFVAAPDPTLEGPYVGIAELSEKIADSVAAQDCWATNWYRYAMGRMESPADTCSLEEVQARFRASGGDLKDLLVGIVLSDTFRYRPPAEGDS